MALPDIPGTEEDMEENATTNPVFVWMVVKECVKMKLGKWREERGKGKEEIGNRK